MMSIYQTRRVIVYVCYFSKKYSAAFGYYYHINLNYNLKPHNKKSIPFQKHMFYESIESERENENQPARFKRTV